MNVKAQITFNASNKSIKEVIEMIEEKADYSFFYSDELSDLNRKVNLSFHDENIENVLRTLFKGTNIVYKIEGDKQVVLSLQSTLKKAKSNKSVSGKIVDTDILHVGTSVRSKSRHREIPAGIRKIRTIDRNAAGSGLFSGRDCRKVILIRGMQI